MNGRGRVEAALAMGVADRPPVGAWGHTYREEWSPSALASVTVKRARRFGWDFAKFQPRASSFAEAFGSVYKPAGHPFKGPVLLSAAVPDLDSWGKVELVNRKALDDQVESIGLVARDLGSDVPVIQTVFSPIPVGGDLVGTPPACAGRDPRGVVGFQPPIGRGGGGRDLLRDFRLHEQRRHVGERLSRDAAAVRRRCAGTAAGRSVVQRRASLRFAFELRSGTGLSRASDQLVGPQPGQSITGRR